MNLSTSIVSGQRGVKRVFDYSRIKKEFDPEHGFSNELKQEFRALSQRLTFTDFIEFRRHLKLDRFNIKEFAKRCKALVDSNQSRLSRQGLNLEQFIELIGGFSLPLDRLYYVILSFYYLDFNDNHLLEIDEILQGFILMGNGSEMEKIEAAFLLIDKNNNNILELSELESYLRAVKNLHFL